MALNLPASLFTQVGSYEIMKTNLSKLPVEILPESSNLDVASGNDVNTLGTFNPNVHTTFSISAEVTKSSWSTPVSDVVLFSYLEVAGQNGIRVHQESTDGKLYVTFLNNNSATFTSDGYDITTAASGAHSLMVARVSATSQDVYWDGVLVASGTDATDSIGIPTAATKVISAISKAPQAQITTSTAHGRTTGDLVTLSGIVGTQTMNARKNKGMESLNGNSYIITVTAANTFTINVDSSNFDTYDTSGVSTYNAPRVITWYTGTTNKLITANKLTAIDAQILHKILRDIIVFRDSSGNVETSVVLPLSQKESRSIKEYSDAADSTRYNQQTVELLANQTLANDDGLSGFYQAIDWKNGGNGTFTIQAIEGVARSRAADAAMTMRGGYFRTYVTPGGATARTNIGCEMSARAGYSGGNADAPENGTAFIGARIWMAPYFASDYANINNFHALWIYNEHATQAVTNGIKIGSAGGGFTNDINLQKGGTISELSTNMVLTPATNGYMVLASSKADTGDPASPVEGMIYINPTDNKIQMYADGGWRTISSW